MDTDVDLLYYKSGRVYSEYVDAKLTGDAKSRSKQQR